MFFFNICNVYKTWCLTCPCCIQVHFCCLALVSTVAQYQFSAPRKWINKISFKPYHYYLMIFIFSKPKYIALKVCFWNFFSNGPRFTTITYNTQDSHSISHSIPKVSKHKTKSRSLWLSPPGISQWWYHRTLLPHRLPPPLSASPSRLGPGGVARLASDAQPASLSEQRSACTSYPYKEKCTNTNCLYCIFCQNLCLSTS